jgi:AcrR family transcriptional regulator
MTATSGDSTARTAPHAPSPRDSDGTEQRLLSAGLDLFSRRGYAAASVNEIVRQAGCCKGAFYFHFASKKELFFKILENRIARKTERLLDLCRWEGDTAEWLGRLFETIVGFSQSEPVWRALSAEFMVLGMRDPSVRQRVAEMHRDFRDQVASVLAAGADCRGGRLIADPDIVAVAVGAMLDGVVIHSAIEPDALPMPETAHRLKPMLAAWVTRENS